MDLGNMGGMNKIHNVSREIAKLRQRLDSGKITAKEFEKRKNALERNHPKL